MPAMSDVGADDDGEAGSDGTGPGGWNEWCVRSDTRKWTDQDASVAQDPEGQVVVALVFIRGENVHKRLRFGQLLGFGLAPFGNARFGVGTWCWSAYTRPADSSKIETVTTPTAW